MDTFFPLIHSLISGVPFIPRPGSEEEWEALFAVTAKHNFLGLTFPIIDRLHDEEEIPLGVYTRWAMVAEKIKAKNEYQQEACRRLGALFGENGFRCCLLKGQAAAAYYPDPKLRHSGDIDVWVEGERDAVLEFLRPRYSIGKVVYHHCDVKMFKASGVEVHFTPTWMNSPFANRRLQRWVRTKAPEQFSNCREELGLSVPAASFDAVYMLIHIYRHVLEEGVGLRQLLDYYHVLQSITEEQRQQVLGDLRHLHLTGFASQVMYVLRQVFGLEEEKFLCQPDDSGGAFLLEEIMLSGNFGRLDPRNAHDKGEGLIAHGRRKFGRGVRFFFHYPSEVFWMPFFMIWQYFWRRRRGYLFKGR